MMEASKKEEMLRACLEEFAENGYEKANTNRICDAAGVSKGLLFHYFGTKKNLYLTCVENCIQDLLQSFVDFSVKGEDFYHAISAYGEVKLRFYSEHPLHYRMMIGAFYSTPKELRPELSKRYEELNRYSYQVLEDLIQKIDLKPGVTVQQAMIMVGAVLSAIEKQYSPLIVSHPDCDETMLRKLEDETMQLINLMLYGIAEKPNG